MTDLNKHLDLILEDVIDSPLDIAVDIQSEVKECEYQLELSKRRLSMAIDRINGDLAMSIRKVQPGLHIVLDKNGCKVGYKSKSLIFSPDLTTKYWNVNGQDPRFLRKFQKRYGEIALRRNISKITKCIVTFFNEYYKSLHEDIVGVGNIIINDKKTTMMELSNWRISNTVV